MPVVSESVLVEASLAECWATYFDARTWGSWVDGFQAIVEAAGGYPESGGTLRWRSVPAGRGEVGERVLEHEPRRRHRISFTDPAMEGELQTTFAIEGEGTRVAQKLTYRLVDRGPIARLGAILFVKAQVRASVQRSLLSFRREVEERSQFEP